MWKYIYISQDGNSNNEQTRRKKREKNVYDLLYTSTVSEWMCEGEGEENWAKMNYFSDWAE